MIYFIYFLIQFIPCLSALDMRTPRLAVVLLKINYFLYFPLPAFLLPPPPRAPVQQSECYKTQCPQRLSLALLMKGDCSDVLNGSMSITEPLHWREQANLQDLHVHNDVHVWLLIGGLVVVKQIFKQVLKTESEYSLTFFTETPTGCCMLKTIWPGILSIFPSAKLIHLDYTELLPIAQASFLAYITVK